MATNSTEEKWEGSNSDQEQEEEEETLSLCDLPLNLINKENQSSKEEVQASNKTEEDFDFGSLIAKQEMCAADDVFFKGQILPSRLSLSSESGLTKTHHHSQNPSRCVSRSESMDHGSLGRFTSNSSSRSSSSRSHYSSSSTSTSSIVTTKTNLKPRIRNNFHTHPSPKPQIRITNSTRLGNVSNRTPQKSSSVWDFFRLGLVRTPEIELQDLKVRNSVSRNSSSSSNSDCSIKNGAKINMEKQKRLQSLLDKRRGGGFFGGDCKCSVSAVEAVPLNNIVIIKSCTTNGGTSSNNKSTPSSATHAMKEKLEELKQKQKQGKQNMSRHRTFEWLKELSQASYPDEA